MVGYSGWSTSNNLIRPYNSDLNFGTGDFSFTTWAKTSNDDAHNNYIIRSGLLINGNTWSGNGQAILVYNNQHKPVLNVTANNFISSTQVIGPSNLNDGIWHHIVALRRSGTLEMYVDGNLVSTQSGSTQNVVNTSRKLMIGHVDDAVGFWKGDLALIRISVSSPSATQIKKIYEDEKVLFQENAKATIYGSSDSVTALAFDDDTNLLHVGTSGGRSDFQGLRRINNTTTAVTTAISASNDLVAEQ